MIESVANAPVFLWGMMGTGKSTVGSRLAHRLGRPFVDLDAEIERSAGQTINSIFESAGEETFRTMEQEALHSILKNSGSAVVALGGGALLDETTRHAVRAVGPLLTLHAPVETLEARLENDDSRPLLRDETLETIATARAAAYRDVDCIIDASSDDADTVVVAVETALGMRGQR